MKLTQGDKEVTVNTLSNWPLIEDLFVKWRYPVTSKDEVIEVINLDMVTSELSAWGIPWKYS